MSRTKSGQSWTHKNAGRLIKFGGVWPTVMALTGDATSSPTGSLPPYQSVKQRKIVKKYNEIITVDESYAGGARINLGTTQSEPGGWWHNGKNLSISWLNGVLYTQGKYGFPISPPVDYELFSAALLNQKEIVLIFRKQLTSPLRYNYILQRNSISAFFTNEFNTSSVSSLSLGDFDFYTQITGFDSTARNIAYLETTGTDQDITLLTFSEDYSSYTTSLIHSRSMQTITRNSTTTVSGSGAIWETASSTSLTLNSGDPRIDKLVMELDSLCAKSIKYTSASSTGSASSQSCTGRDGFAYDDDHFLIDYSLIFENVSFPGVVTDLFEITGFKEEFIRSYALDYVYSTNTATLEWSINYLDSHPIFSASASDKNVYSVVIKNVDSTVYRHGVNSTLTTELDSSETIITKLNSLGLSSNLFSDSQNTTNPSSSVITDDLAILQQLTPPSPTTSSTTIETGTSGENLPWAFGVSEGLAQFIINDPFSSANVQYQLTVSLDNPANYVFTEEQVLPTGAIFTSQIGVTTK